MELVLLVIAILGAIFAYFAVGIALRWFLEWWILAISTPILIAVGIQFGWAGAVVALIGFAWRFPRTTLGIHRTPISAFQID